MIAFLSELRRRLGPLTVVWDRNPIHGRSKAVRMWLAYDDVSRMVPAGGPSEKVWAVQDANWNVTVVVGAEWQTVAGLAVRDVAVGADGLPWVVNTGGNVFRQTGPGPLGTGWEMLPFVGAVDVGVGSDGSVWVLAGAADGAGNRGVYRWTGSGWQQVSGAGSAVGVGPDGRPWVADAAGERFHRNTTAAIAGVSERFAYDPFGQATVLGANWAAKAGGSEYDWVYLHQGGRLDRVSGLYHFRNRDYSPTLGRFAQRDPIGGILMGYIGEIGDIRQPSPRSQHGPPIRIRAMTAART